METNKNFIERLKENNLWYKETWKNGYRYKYQIIPEEVAQKLIKKI